MEWIAISQFWSGHWFLADVGNIQYCLLNTLHGDFMYSPLMEANHFAYHFTPFFFLLLPITFLSSYAIPLVSSYVLALALCPVAIYVLARREGTGAASAVALGFCFLGNHFVGSLELANHFESWFVLFFLCLMCSRPGSRVFWVFAFLTLSVKEDAIVWTGGYALLEFWRTRNTAFRNLIIVCASWLVVAVLIMVLIGAQEGHGAFEYASRASGAGIGWDSLRVAALLISSFALLPLAAGRSALLLLLPAPMLLAGFPFVRHLLYYYSYPFLPYLVLASARGIARLEQPRKGNRPSGIMAGLCIAALLLAGAVQFFMPTRTDDYVRKPFSVTARDKYRMQVAREFLPADSPAVIQFGLWGITPNRADARKLKKEYITPDACVFLDLHAPYGIERSEYITLASGIMDDVTAGKRKLLHSSYDIYVVGPANSAKSTR
jgi:uncharacterized membrane protein